MTRAFSDDLCSRIWLLHLMVCRRGGSRLDVREAYIVGVIEEAKDITLDAMMLRLAEERAYPLAVVDWMPGCESAAGLG